MLIPVKSKKLITQRYDCMILKGIPDSVKEEDKAVFRSRICDAVMKLLEKYNIPRYNFIICSENNIKSNVTENVENKKYFSIVPLFDFQQLVLPKDTLEELLSASDLLKVQKKVFEDWGLKKIEPFPRTCINLYGPPGTGKTLAAHAVAKYLEKEIIVASYAEIESKYHGDGPKNVKALFIAAEKADALLFIDEADSLLSKRLINVTQGSEQAINSMRSQLLICLEQYSGIVIFSTNLVENYDKAFETRVRHIQFKMPDEICRKKIWDIHLTPELPTINVSSQKLAQDFTDVCGREIKNAVINAAVKNARRNIEAIEHSDLENAIAKIINSRIVKNKTRGLTRLEEKSITSKLKKRRKSK